MATYWENSCSFGLRYVSWYKYLIVNLFFSHLGFWNGNLFLIAPFPDLCLLVPFLSRISMANALDKALYSERLESRARMRYACLQKLADNAPKHVQYQLITERTVMNPLSTNCFVLGKSEE